MSNYFYLDVWKILDIGIGPQITALGRNTKSVGFKQYYHVPVFAFLPQHNMTFKKKKKKNLKFLSTHFPVIAMVAKRLSNTVSIYFEKTLELELCDSHQKGRRDKCDFFGDWQ